MSRESCKRVHVDTDLLIHEVYVLSDHIVKRLGHSISSDNNV